MRSTESIAAVVIRYSLNARVICLRESSTHSYGTVPQPPRVRIPDDVRALKGLRSTRHSKGEPPLQKIGLPLAMRSVCRLRVPLRPRKAVKHPGTLGTVRDVTIGFHILLIHRIFC